MRLRRRRSREAADVRPRVLIIVQNLPVPFDRRVWLESQTLASNGYAVTVISPKGEGDPRRQVLDGIQLIKYRPYAPGGGALGYLFEYAYSFTATSWCALRARRGGAFEVVQACNPPDVFWPLARWFKLRDGSRFVFDHHDLCPELFESRFPDGPSLSHRGLLFLERMTFRTADHVISTNESYAEVARKRGGKSVEDVTVVRTGPDPDRLQPREARPELRRGRTHLVAYIGVMGPQDGVDIVVRAAEIVVHELGRDDIAFTLMGKGDSFDDLVALRDELNLHDHVEFTGRVPDETVLDVLSTAAVGLSPDPKNALNDVSTMNKTMEYMSMGVPVVAFDLRETRVSAGAAARYVEPNFIAAYAQAIVDLVDDPAGRAAMGDLGRRRVVEELAWQHQSRIYRGVFDRLVGRKTPVETPEVIWLPDRESQHATARTGT